MTDQEIIASLRHSNALEVIAHEQHARSWAAFVKAGAPQALAPAPAAPDDGTRIFRLVPAAKLKQLFYAHFNFGHAEEETGLSWERGVRAGIDARYGDGLDA
jgi:hypothetical protein